MVPLKVAVVSFDVCAFFTFKSRDDFCPPASWWTSFTTECLRKSHQNGIDLLHQQRTKDKTQAASESELLCISGDELGKDAENARQAVGESDSLCVTYEKSIDDNGLLCESCYQLEHNQCASISDEAYSILSDSPPNIMFFCTACRAKVTGALKFFNDMHDKQINLDKSLKKLEVDMQNIQKDFTKRVSRLEKQINQ